MECMETKNKNYLINDHQLNDLQYISRILETSINKALARGKSILLLGARQTGKTTLINRFKADLSISFIQPIVRQLYEQQISILTGEIEVIAEKTKDKPLIILDEVQKIPEALNIVQDLIDRNIAQFILTGSSARKLYSGSKINLLPGRIVVFKLDPLTYLEIQKYLTFISSTTLNNSANNHINNNTSTNISSNANHTNIETPLLKNLLLYGTLPGIFKVLDPNDKEIDLSSYVTTYLEEEIRSEALVRNVGFFSRFLQLAAAESGNILNFRKLAQEIGVAHTTIAGYYQILEDCLIAERIEPLTKTNTRRKLIKSPKYLFFDLGVRRISALEGNQLPQTYLGKLFEQFIGLELTRIIKAKSIEHQAKIYFWRDLNGQEIDWIILNNNMLTPIEVKLTNKPNLADCKILKLFKQEYPNSINGYLVCQIVRKIKLADGLYAIPWQELEELL